MVGGWESAARRNNHVIRRGELSVPTPLISEEGTGPEIDSLSNV